MSENPEIGKSGAETRPPGDNAVLDEAVWQKWVNKNIKRDAERRRKAIWVLCLLFPLLLLCAVVLVASR
jgi:hypothetical protein